MIDSPDIYKEKEIEDFYRKAIVLSEKTHPLLF